MATSTAKQQQAALDATKDQYLAIEFLLSTDSARYGKMIDDLMNKFLKGNKDAFNQYYGRTQEPSSLEE